jgi:tetratricopeptide (TPR) repeat protein
MRCNIGLAELFVVTVLSSGGLGQVADARGNEACAGCHAEIYKTYSKTVMATASGAAADGVITGEFIHKVSGVHYRVYEKGGGQTVRCGQADAGCAQGTDEGVRSHTGGISSYKTKSSSDTVWMSYEREQENGFRGERELLYFIGSGVKGRSYLFSVQGFLFETPINWYAQEQRWNMTPAYTEARESPMSLPALVDCLNCHTSGLQAPVAGTDNKFSGEPFQHGGITCQRCHGAGEGHGGESAASSTGLASPVVAGSGPAQANAGCAPGTDECVRSRTVHTDPSHTDPSHTDPSHTDRSHIVNPGELTAERRDAVCMECHFEGTVAVEQPGKQLYQFQPGDRLEDYIHYFLLEDGREQKTQAVSQFEALSLSACQRKSGDRMWCGSCHDPHREPGAAEKAEYYRGKCLSCHGEAFAARHHPDKKDCVGCHMPALPSKDVAHTEATDHRILRNPKGPQLESPRLDNGTTPRLVSFPARDAGLTTSRDLALAWETLAQRGAAGASRQAEQYLRKAVKDGPEDAVLLAALGFVEQEAGHEKEARELYERALKIDPLANDAATNLGAIEARSGNLRRAVELWQGAFERVPYRSAIGMNLALAFCATGQKEDARRYLGRVLEFNPDFGKAKEMVRRLEGNEAECGQ